MIQGLQFLRDPIDFVGRLHRRYGDVFAITVPSFGRVVFVADPALVKQIFTGDTSIFHAGEANAEVVLPILGPNSLLVLDEDEHLRERKILLPPFHGSRAHAHGELFRELTERDISSWPVGKPFSMHSRMKELTLEIILRAIFGLRAESRLARGREVMAEFSHRSNAVGFFPYLRHDLGPFSPWGRFERARDALHEFVQEEVASRTASPAEDRDDVLSLLLQSSYEDGSSIGGDELRDELVTIIAAGHETTAVALAWTFDRVLHTPRVLTRLRESIAAGEDAYLDATIKETLRMRPVLTEVARRLTRPIEIGGYLLPAGSVVMPSIAALHYREDLYPRATEFRPERFLEDTGERYSWIPFGGGTRRCPGAPFALYEMRVILRTILECADLRAADPDPDRVKMHNATKVPARGARVILESPPEFAESGPPVAVSAHAAPR